MKKYQYSLRLFKSQEQRLRSYHRPEETGRHDSKMQCGVPDWILEKEENLAWKEKSWWKTKSGVGQW